MKYVEAGGILGDLEFFKEGTRNHSVMTVEVTRLCYLDLSSVLEIIREFPEDH